MLESQNLHNVPPIDPVPPTREELAEKHNRVVQYLDQNSLDGVLLFTSTNIAWYTGGGEVHISIASPNGACVLLITRERVVIIADAIEAPKMENEALKIFLATSSVPARIEVRRWYDNIWKQVESLAKGLVLGTDEPLAPGLIKSSSQLGNVTFKLCGRDFIRLRYRLTPREIERYRSIGKRSAVAIENAASKVRKGQSEFEISALLNQAMINFGLLPTLSLIAADQRIASYRHPVPTTKTVENYCMLVTCTRAGGLICSATRIVHFGSLSAELRRKHDAVVQVDGALLAGSRPNASMSTIFNTVKEAYAKQGFAGEEEMHHQGGATGYLAREYKCEPQSEDNLYESQAVAWNPSIAGTKSEDTYLVAVTNELDGAESLECLTHSAGNWPLIKVTIDGKTFYRPDILIL
jgi:Xaa-Pro dipeptidase